MAFIGRPDLIQRYAPFLPGLETPAQDWDECPKICVSYNETWVPLIIGALQAMSWADLYAGDPDRAQDVADQVQNLIVAFATGNIPCGDDMAYLLRQKPSYPCVLEQSIDNGLTWTVAFDFGLCQPAVGAPSTFELELNAINFSVVMNYTKNIYDGTPGSVAPDSVMDGTGDDDIRNQAMCFAVNQLIATIAVQYEEKINRGWTWQDYAKLAAGTVALGSGIVLVLAPLAGVTLGYAASTGLAIVEAISLYAYQTVDMIPPVDNFGQVLDSDIQRLLVCSAMDVLGGTTPDLLTFASIFDGVDPGVFTDDTLTLLKHIVEQEDMYLHFLNLVQGAYDAIQDGQSFTCPCDKYTRTFDFTAESGSDPFTTYGQHDWIVHPENAGCGTYQSGTGWLFGTETTEDYTKHRGVNIDLDGINGNIDKVVLVFDYTMGNLEDTNLSAGVISYGGDSIDFVYFDMANGVDITLTRNAYRDMSDNLLHVGVFSDGRQGTWPPFTGDGVLKKIIVTGYGTKPAEFTP